MFAQSSPPGAFDRYKYHRDRLVDLGVYNHFQYQFQKVASVSLEARAIVRLITTRHCPPHQVVVSSAPRADELLKIWVICYPEDTSAWEKFAFDYDIPPK